MKTENQKKLKAYNYMYQINMDLSNSFHSLPIDMQENLEIQDLYKSTVKNVLAIIDKIIPIPNGQRLADILKNVTP